jgi:hypothetical protein
MYCTTQIENLIFANLTYSALGYQKDNERTMYLRY